jgi:hypothetical protein
MPSFTRKKLAVARFWVILIDINKKAKGGTDLN